jgi:hypothetical protein
MSYISIIRNTSGCLALNIQISITGCIDNRFCMVYSIFNEILGQVICDCMKCNKQTSRSVSYTNGNAVFGKQGYLQRTTYEMWPKSNATGNAVHEPTKLLPPPSHDS